MAHKKAQAGKWRRRFLGAMARTANAELSARMAGVDKSTAFALRKRDSGFARDWARARDWGRARARAQGRPVFPGGRPRPEGRGEALDPRPLKVRRRREGGTEIVRCGEGRQSPETDRLFFAHLAAGHGVRRSAAAAGFSTNALYARRMIDPGFAAQWEAARDQCVARNDMLLIDCVPRALDPEAGDAAEGLPRPTIAEAIQIQRLYRRKEEEGGRGRRRWGPPPPSIEEVTEKIVRRVGAIRRHREAKQLAQGWVRDEAGNLIPPGWAKGEGRE